MKLSRVTGEDEAGASRPFMASLAKSGKRLTGRVWAVIIGAEEGKGGRGMVGSTTAPWGRRNSGRLLGR